MKGTKGTQKLSWDLRTFLTISVLIAVPANILMLLFQDNYSLQNYIDSTSVEMLFIATLMLLLVTPRVKSRSFRITAIILASGFMMQLASAAIRYYYIHLSDAHRLPTINPGDFLYLGSYFLFAAAVFPYIRRYHGLTSERPAAAMLAYSALGATILLIAVNYWSEAMSRSGYDLFQVIMRLSNIVVPMACLFFALMASLLYVVEGFGKGLPRYYWIYSMIPIGVLASADILAGSYYSLQEGAFPLRIIDVLHLTAYALAISAALRLLRSEISSVSSFQVVLEKGTSQVHIVIKKGRGYVVEDTEAALSFEMFRRLLDIDDGGRKPKGYIISRAHPTEIVERYGIKDIPMAMLGSHASVAPKHHIELESVARSIRDFFSSTRNGAVLLDGIESLIVDNDLKKINIMLEQINDFVRQYRSYLIVSIDPKAFDAKEIEIIEDNFDVIRAVKPAAR